MGTTSPYTQETGPERQESRDAQALELETMKDRENMPYPNASSDPDPMDGTETQDEREAYGKTLKKYSEEIFQAYGRMTTLRGNSMWLDFITAFRPHKIKTWTMAEISEWCQLLNDSGVHVEISRSTRRTEGLIDVLYRENNIESHPGRQLEDTHEDRNNQNPPEIRNENAHTHDLIVKRSPQEIIRSSGNDPSDSSSSDESQEEGNPPPKMCKPKTNPGEEGESSPRSAEEEQHSTLQRRYGLGIGGLMKAVIGKATFSGTWEEDLYNCISVFDTLARMCQVIPEEKLQEFPMILNGDTLRYFSSRMQEFQSYEDGFKFLRDWYNSDEKSARILTAWKRLLLSEQMSKEPDASEVSVFSKFIANLMRLQNQLDYTYYSYQFLRDRLLTAVDLPHLQISLRDRMPRTSQKSMKRISNQLSEKPKTAGLASAHLAQEGKDEEEAVY